MKYLKVQGSHATKLAYKKFFVTEKQELLCVDAGKIIEVIPPGKWLKVQGTSYGGRTLVKTGFKTASISESSTSANSLRRTRHGPSHMALESVMSAAEQTRRAIRGYAKRITEGAGDTRES